MEGEKLIIRSSTPDGVIDFDEHGFAVFSEDQVDIERSHRYTGLPNTSDEHLSTWEKYIADWPTSYINSPNKLRFLLRKGIPRALRPTLWGKLLGCEQQQKTSSFSYTECVRALRSQMVELGISEYCFRPNHQAVLDEDEDGTSRRAEEEMERHQPAKMKHLIPLQILRQIVVDLERTFPTHRLFMGSKPEAKEGRASLFRLLSVYALYNPNVGYCQGMSYLVGMLLMVMDGEEEVFWAMVALFEKPKFLAGYFDKNLKRIQSHASLFHKLLGQRFPRVARHFDSLGVQPLMYVTPWFMCLYTSLPCWDTVLAIWDLIFMDGVTTIFRVGLSLIDIHQDQILGNTDLTKILPPLLHPKAERVHHEVLIPAVWKMNVEKWEIETLQAIVAEEKDPIHSGMKRRHHAERTFGEVSQDNKRIRLEEKPKPTTTNSFFQRVINIFTPRNQRDDELQGGSVSSSQGQRQGARHSQRLTQKGPGTARPERHRTRSKVRELSKVESTSGKTSEARSGWNPPAKDCLVSASKPMKLGVEGDTYGARCTRSGFTSPGSSQKRKGGATANDATSNAGSKHTPLRISVAENRVAFKGLRQEPLTPRSPGRSKMFGRLHAQIFGTEEPLGPPKLSHPLEDLAMASPERTTTRARRSLDKETSRSPEQPQRTSPRVSTRSQRPTSRSGWLSPYCKQYMVNPILQARRKTPQRKASQNPTNISQHRHRSPPRSETPALDFAHVASPNRGALMDKENNLNQTLFLDGQKSTAPSMESLESTPDGVLSVLGEQNSQAWTEMRSPLSDRYSNNNNDFSFKTPSHPMNLRPKQFTPGMYTHARTPRSEDRHLLAWHNPMNMPSARRLVCRSAKAQHSFKMFHTPTPLRQSKVLDLYQSPNLSSPEVELTTMSFASPSSTLNLSGMNLDD